MKATQVCSVDGCERKHYARGMCDLHYRRLRRSGALDPIPIPSPAEQLAAGLERKPNGCLEWTRYTNDSGYGVMLVNGMRVRAHRLAWELTNGPIPEGLNACHKCDNPPCCDVAHLFLGTHADNFADMAAKGRHHSQTRTHCPQGHPYDEANTIMYQGRRYCRACHKIRTSK